MDKKTDDFPETVIKIIICLVARTWKNMDLDLDLDPNQNMTLNGVNTEKCGPGPQERAEFEKVFGDLYHLKDGFLEYATHALKAWLQGPGKNGLKSGPGPGPGSG